jgi:oligopeptide transport system substrate-binding protein
MRFSIERAVSPALASTGGGASYIVSDIAGFDAYRNGRDAHISGIRVRGDQLQITLKRPAPDFPARISMPPFSAVPLGTPLPPHGIDKPLPSAGPYYLASHVGDSQEVLRRNPNYKGDRPHKVEAFVVSNDIDAARAVDLVTSGKADIAAAPPPASNGGTAAAWRPDGDLARRFGRPSGNGPRFVSVPVPAVRFLAFNTRRGIFRDPALRRAVGLVLDRAALARAIGERPWNSFIGPGMPGAPDADAAVAGPRLAKAKALARGRGGKALMLINIPDRCRSCAALGALVRRQLALLGIRLTVRASGEAPAGFFNPDQRADLMQMGWAYDWPDPSNLTNALFDPAHPLGYGFPDADALYDGAAAVRALRAANLISGPARGPAFVRAEARLLATSPPGTPITLGEQPTLLGKRVGCASFLPQDQGLVDLTALCLH